MPVIQLVNESQIPKQDMDTIYAAVSDFTAMVAKAWNIPNVTVNSVNGDWLICITTRNRHPMALGYHTVENGQPIAYIDPLKSPHHFGRYVAPKFLKGLKKYLPTVIQPGLVTVICHEIAEMLCDPFIQTVSAVDNQGRKWLVEVCDHVNGNYFILNKNGVDCVLPDVTTPSFYDPKGAAPYDLMNKASAPFTLTDRGYAYYKDDQGNLHQI